MIRTLTRHEMIEQQLNAPYEFTRALEFIVMVCSCNHIHELNACMKLTIVSVWTTIGVSLLQGHKKKVLRNNMKSYT